MPGLAPRDYTIEEYTTTVCPQCFAERPRRSDEADVFRDGMLVTREGKVWLRRWCPAHGETESLYEEDAEIWRARAGWGTPTLQVTPDRAENWGPSPGAYREGLPASHGQHTCILLLNLTERCNYGCPTCYAASQPPGTPVPPEERPTLPEILRTVDAMLAREAGKLSVLMLSGGEPTVRDDLPQIIRALADRPITRILLNTNGRRIARDDRFLQFLRENRKRVEVYLQFDGLRPETHRTLRDEDAAEEKLRALRRLNEAGVWTTLVATVQRGVNEDEIGALARLGLETPRCVGLAVQPAFGSGRTPEYDGRDRVTPTGVLRRLGAQTGGMLDWSDFIPLPCSHRDCCDITYLLKTEDGSWKSIPRLIGKGELKRWIHLVSNSISFETLNEPVRALIQSGTLQRVFSEQLPVRAPALALDLANMCDCIPGLPELLGAMWSRVRGEERALERMAERTFRITVKMFMDTHTFHEARLRQCCVHTGTFEEDPRRYSFCWRWLFADATDTPGAALIPVESIV